MSLFVLVLINKEFNLWLVVVQKYQKMNVLGQGISLKKINNENTLAIN